MQVKSKPTVWSAGDAMQRQQSSTSLASATGRREVSDEDIAAYAKQLSGPRFGTPRIFATSAKLGACCRFLPHCLFCVVMTSLTYGRLLPRVVQTCSCAFVQEQACGGSFRP